MLGSSQSVAEPNIALNTIMAEELRQFADILEVAENFDETLHDLVCKAFTDHQHIIFDGNGYSDAWREEAARRGLSNYTSTAEALSHYVTEKNIQMVTGRGIFTENEFRARHAIHVEAYNKVVNIEARTMVDMALHQILPSALHYTRDLCANVKGKQELGASCKAESALIKQLSEHTDSLYDSIETLRRDLDAVPGEVECAASYYRDRIVPEMKNMRFHADILEQLTDKSYWPYPTYSDLLFY
jgi:glutamine synthetase